MFFLSLKNKFSFLKVFACSGLQFVLGAAVFFTLINIAFFKNAYQALGMESIGDYLLMASFILFIFCFLNIFFSLVLVPYLRKPLLIGLLFCSAIGSYFSLFYGTYIDSDMMTNVLQTNLGESASLITLRLIIWIILFAVIPSFFVIFLVKVKDTSVVKSCLLRLINIAISFILLATIYFCFAGGYSFFLKNHKPTLKLLTPTNYIYGIIKYNYDAHKAELPFVHIAEDAKRQPAVANQKKKLVILVVGETSRAKNFSLNGYARDTNPLLSKQTNLFNFVNASSCGTATAISVPCMFSNMPRKDYDAGLAARQDNLLDILARTGINVYWKENDSSCKGVCARIANEEINKTEPKEMCPGGLCYDITLLNNLENYITSRQDDTVIVLHTNGSHGPAYYQRYQSAQEKFTPTCNTNQIDNCPHEQLVNVYDNTIVNVDYVLNATIELLKKYDKQFSTAMLYMSDHGESLGENGFYLHVAPYRIAPKEQTHIPMIFWLSNSFIKDQQINKACLLTKAKTDNQVSHDNLFHTVLGIMKVTTTAYQSDLDLLKSCEQ